LLLLGLAACGGQDGGDGRLRVVTTLPLFADFVRQVGGDRVEVTSLLPSGADPHTYEPSPQDVRRVAEADLVFANGLDLEPAALKTVAANARKGSVVLLGEEAKKAPFQPFIPDDPHLWMHPLLGSVYARSVAAHLGDADPEGRAQYEDGYTRFDKEIQDADSYVRAKVAGIPPEKRKLVTTHDAFGYLAQAFGLKVVAVVAPGPGQETTPARVAELAQAIRQEGVPAVFQEPQAAAEGKVLEQAAADAGVQVCTLYSDSLDDRVSSYVELLRFDGQELARCLGGASE
jgi:ABC-type Zn uptake system ZnuABC Zn-binding protein ZnuA